MVVWTVHCSRKGRNCVVGECKWKWIKCNLLLYYSDNLPCLKVVFIRLKKRKKNICSKQNPYAGRLIVATVILYASDAVNHLMCLMNACQYNVVLKVMQVTHTIEVSQWWEPQTRLPTHHPDCCRVSTAQTCYHICKQPPHCFAAGTESLDSNVHSQLYKWMIIIIYNCTDDLINILLINDVSL